ncbi:MAG TPA: hypothetical protein VMZ92_03250 [Planctomycetota bacterium]|nr:hypothetical protein [Planctomycetota bacterium]
MKIIRGLFQWALLGAFTLTAMFLGAQTFPPGGGAGGAASAPTSQVDGCVIPGYNFATLTAMGMCHDDGTGPYGFNAVAVQTSDPTDLEYAGLVCSEGDPTFCQAIAFDDGGNNGVSFFWQAIGVTTPAAQFVLNASDFTGGVTGSVDITAVANDAGPYTLTSTVTNGAAVCAVVQTELGLGLCTFAFATLPASPNGYMVYCSDCTNAAPCAAVGTGNIAKRENAAWNCD